MSQSDKTLGNLLKSARVPERGGEYWEQFPGCVTRRLAEGARSAGSEAPRSLPIAWAVGLATACAVVGLGTGWWMTSSRVPSQPDYAKLYAEVASVFPRQIRAIVVNEDGPRLVLADQPSVPASAPVLLRLCRDRQCQNVITFSGQRVRVNGESIELLTDGRGDLLVIGRRFLWSSADPRPAGNWRIDAKRLGGVS